MSDFARPVTSALTVEFGSSAARNTYMAPMLYEGNSLSVHYERWRGMKHPGWITMQFIDADLAKGDAEHGKHSSMWSVRATYRYSMLREFEKFEVKGIKFFLGGYAGIDGGFDYNLKTAGGNNPSAVRSTENVGLSAVAKRNYNIRNKPCEVMLQLQMPLMGMALMPEFGASYYETFMLKTADNNLHFTSLHNQQDADVRLTTDIPLAVIPGLRKSKTVIRVGGFYHIETMDVNHIVERYSTLGICVGWTWRYLPL